MATPEFLARWRSRSGALALLARISLPRVDATQTDLLYVAMSDEFTPANSANGDPARAWTGAVISFGSIHVPGAFGSTDLSLATASVTMYADHIVTFPAGVGARITETLRQSMATHVWLNASVTIYRYFAELGDFKHAQVIGPFGVIEPALVDDKLTINLRQLVPWNKPMTTRTVGKQEFPRAPDATVGLPLPINVGPYVMAPMRRPWETSYPTGYKQFACLSASRLSRFAQALLVDVGRGGGATPNGNALILEAGHKVSSVYDDTKGTALWTDLGTSIGLLDSASTVVNTVTGAGITIPEQFANCLIGMPPSDVLLVGSSAGEPKNALEPSDATYAFFDYTGNKRELRVIFQATPDQGTLVRYDIVVGYQSSPGLANFALYRRGGADAEGQVGASPVVGLPAAAAPTIVTFPVNVLNFSNDYPENACVAVKWSAANAGNFVKVFFLGLVLTVKPKRVIVESGRSVNVGSNTPPQRGQGHGGSYSPYTVPAQTPPVTIATGNFYANWIGAPDDAGGTYTSVSNGVIQRAPDMMTYLLVTYGGLTLADIERGASTFGSLLNARGALIYAGFDPVHALRVTESADVLTVLLWLAADSFTKLGISPYDGKFRLQVHREDPPVDYPTLLSKDDVDEPMGPDVSLTPVTDVVTDVRVAYGFDDHDRAYRAEVAVGPDRSVAGYAYRSLRDQNLTVVSATNDMLDFRSNSTAGGSLLSRNATLTQGAYTPQTFAAHVKARMGAAESITPAPTSRYQVTWGTAIWAGYNDRLKITRGVATSTIVLDPTDGSMTCEAMAAYIQQKVRTAMSSTAFVFTYDRPTQRYQISVTEQNVVAVWTIGAAASGDYASVHMQLSAWAMLGFYQGGADKAIPYLFPNYGDDRRIEKHFAIMSLGGSGGTPAPQSEFELAFQTGTNGADSTVSVRHCADLLGYVPSEDKLVGFSLSAGHSYCGDCPKGNLETAMKNSADLYGRRRELSIQARTIQQDIAARSLRDRICDLMRGPRPVIRFNTRALPDVEQGHVIGFREEMAKPYPGPGSDGLWVGKKFVVIEYDHEAAPTSLSTQVVAVDIGRLATIVAAVGLGVMMGGILMRTV